MKNPLIKVERTFVRSGKAPKSLVMVANYSLNDKGETVLSPVPEHQKSCAFDGKSMEIANLMYATLPDSLAQVQMQDQQEAAEFVTTQVVRRFGELQKQKDALKKKFENNVNV